MCVDDLGVSRLHSPIYCTVGAATTPQILTSLLECLSLLRSSPSVNMRMVTCGRVCSD